MKKILIFIFFVSFFTLLAKQAEASTRDYTMCYNKVEVLTVNNRPKIVKTRVCDTYTIDVPEITPPPVPVITAPPRPEITMPPRPVITAPPVPVITAPPAPVITMPPFHW